MAQSGDMDCAERLLQPARMVLKTGTHIRYDLFERRLALWNEIRNNQGRYMREECGMFLEEVDLHMRSQFDAALVALASVFIGNNEDLPQVSLYSAEEVAVWQKIERYNVMDLLSQDDLRNRIIKRDNDVLRLLQDYYITMNSYVQATLDNPEIRLTLRYYLKRRWNEYRGKMDAAIADAVTKLGWMQDLVREWEKKGTPPEGDDHKAPEGAGNEH